MRIETKSRRLQLLLQPSLYKRVAKAAQQCDLSVNEYINRVLDEATTADSLDENRNVFFDVGARLYQTSRRK